MKKTMKSLKKKKLQSVWILCILLAGVFVPNVICEAAECILLAGVFVPNVICEAADKGTIQIEYHGRTEKEEEIVLDQAEFICYRIESMQEGQWKMTEDFANAGISLEDETASQRALQAERLYEYAKKNSVHGTSMQEGQWKMTEDFANAGISLEDETASQRALQAERLYEYAKKNSVHGTTVTTDSMGIARIPDLKKGLYLIAQTENWNKKDVGIFSSAPFLLSVPVRINDKEMWKVVCKPKSEWVPEEEQELPKPKPEENKKPDKPKTGDSKPVEMLMLIVILSVCLVAYLTKKKYDYQTKNKNE